MVLKYLDVFVEFLFSILSVILIVKDNHKAQRRKKSVGLFLFKKSKVIDFLYLTETKKFIFDTILLT